MPVLLQTLCYVLSPLRFAEACARRHGECFTIRVLSQPPTVTFSDPEATRDIFASDREVTHAGEVNFDFMSPILGQHSIMVLDGARHLRERRLMLPAFHGERMHAYGRIIREIADRVIDGWPLGRRFPIHPHMQAITLEGIMRAVLGIEHGPQLARLRECLLRVIALPNSPAAAFLAIPALRVGLGGLTPWGRFLRDREEFQQLLFAEIARRRSEGTPGRSDVLSMLMEARDEDGRALSDQELFDQMFTLLMAGQETTASALTWVLHQVLQRPAVLARLREEIRTASAGGTVEAQLGKLEYLDAVIKETARLTPILTNIVRRLRAPMRIGGRDLPAGINVSTSIYLTHRRPDLWPDPERFDPERFLGTQPSPHAFFPFGGGDRRCLGAAFATYEMKIVLARVLSRVALRIAPGYRMRPVMRMVTITPSGGLPVVAEGLAEPQEEPWMHWISTS
jgi:cytochrome P450